MLDKKWIKNNPDKFDLAMKDRGHPQRANEIILMMEMEALDEQIIQAMNSQKKTLAEQFFLLKKISALFTKEEINLMNAEIKANA